MQGGTVARASLTGEKKLENLVEKEILMENPWKKSDRGEEEEKQMPSTSKDERRDGEVEVWKKKEREIEGQSGRTAEREKGKEREVKRA